MPRHIFGIPHSLLSTSHADEMVSSGRTSAALMTDVRIDASEAEPGTSENASLVVTFLPGGEAFRSPRTV